MSDVGNETARTQNSKPTPCGGEDEASPTTEKRDLEFHPIKIKGEPLSETIIRMRRERPY
ncbi:MAG TPA: hypothetical protein VK763_06015 [Terriglobales bacterium]|jgi:hypothetical protein|nr:hypothetical protein [Terriglobales bacterium]